MIYNDHGKINTRLVVQKVMILFYMRLWKREANIHMIVGYFKSLVKDTLN